MSLHVHIRAVQSFGPWFDLEKIQLDLEAESLNMNQIRGSLKLSESIWKKKFRKDSEIWRWSFRETEPEKGEGAGTGLISRAGQ